MDAVGFVGLEGLEVEAVVFLLVDLIVLIIVDGANVVVDAMVTCFVQDDAFGDVVAGRVEGRVLEGVEEEDEEADLVDLVSRKLNAPLSKPPLGNCMKTNSVARVVHSARTDAQRHARLHLLVGIAGRRKEKRKKEEKKKRRRKKSLSLLLLCVRFAAETSDEFAEWPRGCRC
jgi:hypothetical protein